MTGHINYSGLIIAGIGFFVTRSTVTLAIYEKPMHFYLAGVIPLALGLGLAAFGVALTFADIEAHVVRITALWCVIGTTVMLFLAMLTLFGTPGTGLTSMASARSQSFLSNFLIGGSVGGTLTGLYAARNRRHRQTLEHHTNRLVVLNRMLRHEILNAVAAIRGYASLADDDHPEAQDVIEERSIAIERTVDEVKYLTYEAGSKRRSKGSVNLRTCLDESIATIRDRYPDATISVSEFSDELMVQADEQLSRVFIHLLENAIVHAEDESPAVEVSKSTTSISVSVMDAGDGLPEFQRLLLESGDIGAFDNPKTGFGLNIVRLFVEEYNGDIRVDDSEPGTTITITLPRAEPANRDLRPNRMDLANVRPATPHLVVTFVAAILAGIAYGIVAESLGDSVAGIGVFYGTASAIVGWITHEFHSVVFGFVYVGLVSLVPDRFHRGIVTYLGVGIAWALILWVGAASFVAPIWLRLIGIQAPIPSFSVPLLYSHLAWGVSLAILTVLGYRNLLPSLVSLWNRLQTVTVPFDARKEDQR